MQSKSSQWFECKVRYTKPQPDGLDKKVTEAYTVEALSFSEAEAKITEELSSYLSGEFLISDIKIAPYREVFFAEADSADRWYRARLAFITIDEKTEREKRTPVTYLVNASGLASCVRNIEQFMSSTMIDYTIVSIQETALLDVFTI